MGRTTRFLAVFGLTLGLVGCQTFHVRSDWDPETPFAALQRYFWVEPPEVEGANPFADNTLLRKRVRFAMEAQLNQRGFQSADGRGDADFLVTYSVILEDRLRLDGYSTGGGFYRGHYGGFGPIYSTARVRNYQESTLIIDFLDPNNDDLIWRGWGTGIVRTRDRGWDRDRARDRLERGVEAILRAFPPKEARADTR